MGKNLKLLMVTSLVLGVTVLTTVTAFAKTQTSPLSSGVTSVNNAGSADTVKVTSLTEGDIVKIYDEAGGTLIAKGAAVAKGKTESIISIPQIGIGATHLFISLTNKNASESDTYDYTTAAETVSTIPLKTSVTVTNNYGAADTINVANLKAGDVVYVYDSATGGNLIGKGAAVAATKTDSTVTIPQIGAAGKVYVSVLSKTSLESDRLTTLDAVPEVQTTAISSGVTSVNKSGSADTVNITGLAEKDVVKIYDSATGGNVIATGAAVAKGKAESIISIPQIGKSATHIYITVKSVNKSESTRFDYTTVAETVSTAPVKANITVTNNSDTTTNDTIKVTGLVVGDIVNVYDSAKGGELLGTGTKVARGKTDSTVSIKQIGTVGQVYVTVTSLNDRESIRTKPDAVAETVGANLTGLAITGVTSGYTFAAGTYNYTALTVTNDVASIKVTPTGGGVIKVGTSTVVSGATSAAIALTAGTEKIITVTATETGKASVTYTIKITRAQPVAAVATGATATAGTKTIDYTLSTGTFSATTGITKANWTIAGTDGTSLGAITGVVLSNGNKTATITVTNAVASGKTYTVIPKVAALSAGFAVPAAVTTVTVSASAITFTAATNNSTLNDVTTLGLTGTGTPSSSDATVATATIASGKIVIASLKAGTATITVSDGTNSATIAVTVAASGAITIGTITPYSGV